MVLNSNTTAYNSKTPYIINRASSFDPFFSLLESRSPWTTLSEANDTRRTYDVETTLLPEYVYQLILLNLKAVQIFAASPTALSIDHSAESGLRRDLPWEDIELRLDLQVHDHRSTISISTIFHLGILRKHSMSFCAYPNNLFKEWSGHRDFDLRWERSCLSLTAMKVRFDHYTHEITFSLSGGTASNVRTIPPHTF